MTQHLIDTVRRAVRAVRPGDGSTLAAAITSVPAGTLATFLHPTFDRDRSGGGSEAATHVLLTTALGASPGAASGAVVLSADDAVEAAAAGRAVILVRPETTPDDVLGMQSARGVLTCRGGLASHAAVVARGWGIPAVVGASEVAVEPGGLRIGDRLVPVGGEISIDGRTGEVFLGGAGTSTVEAPPELEVLLSWADAIRAAADRPVAVRANADHAADAAHARHLGAQGIGLCRTEHMFLADDRLPLVRRFILTDDPAEEAAALRDLELAQQFDFEGLLVAMDGLPVTVRLLDPPLHEFLPDLERLVVAEATGMLGPDGRAELAAVRRMHEVNPMIGTRGVRLGVVRPGVYQMQVRALCRAIASVAASGRSPHVEVMVPLVVDPAEMRLARGWVDEAVAASGLDPSLASTLTVGAMIETPRAALVAGELAGVAEFFSFGTNDLTQLTFGLSRDDVGARLLPEYLRAGLLAADPFESLDQAGVGRIIEDACERARAARPGIELGVCGEQAGDPDSTRFLVRCGIDYVSCSPYRIPIARLAVAQALLDLGRVTAPALDAIAATTDAVVPPAAATPEPVPPEPGPPGPGTSATEADATTRFTVLHALRIKGFAAVDAIADIAGVDVQVVAALLPDLAESGLCRHIAARDLWQLSASGREHHVELLPLVPADAVAGLREHYTRFLELNLAFKDLCTAWQTRGGEPNDHGDPAYDAARVDELAALHADAEPVLAGFAAAIGRFGAYPQRLATALARTAAGETRMFTGVMCGSYHDVWMELHEDLVQLLGVDRHAEGSY